MALVFQYGSNLSSARLNGPTRLRGDAQIYCVAQTVIDYELRFDIWSDSNECAATDIVAGAGRKIWGVIYDIPDFLIRRETSVLRNRKALDAIEGEGVNYTREQIELKDRAGNRITESVITYIGRVRREQITTIAQYVEHILTGLIEHNLPQEYREYVYTCIRENNPQLGPILPPA